MVNFSDTGEWKLVLSISSSGISAVFKNLIDEDAAPLLFFKNTWDTADINLMNEIEASIYDNPRILEDFATNIVVTTPEALWVPAEFTEDDEFDVNLFTCAYPANDDDIFSDFGNEEVCLYSLVPGLKAFLQRTLPGCKISSHLSVIKPVFESLEMQKMVSESANNAFAGIYINIHENFADIFAFFNGRFLCGATHQWHDIADIAYKVVLVADTYKFSRKETCLNIVGFDAASNDLADMLGEFFASVNRFSLPKLCRDFNVPFAAAVLAGESLVPSEIESI